MQIVDGVKGSDCQTKQIPFQNKANIVIITCLVILSTQHLAHDCLARSAGASNKLPQLAIQCQTDRTTLMMIPLQPI